MTENNMIMINGEKYEVLKLSKELVGLRKFNEKYKMWVNISFSKLDLKAEIEFINNLKIEYLSQSSTRNFKEEKVS